MATIRCPSKNMCSVRTRPMPSAPNSLACRASAGVSALARTSDSMMPYHWNMLKQKSKSAHQPTSGSRGGHTKSANLLCNSKCKLLLSSRLSCHGLHQPTAWWFRRIRKAVVAPQMWGKLERTELKLKQNIRVSVALDIIEHHITSLNILEHPWTSLTFNKHKSEIVRHMPPKHCWNLSHHHLSFASIDGEDLSFSHSHRSHSELGRCIVHSDAARTSHTWPSHSTSNHCRMAGHTTCQRSKSNSLQFHKHHVALSYFALSSPEILLVSRSPYTL